MDSEKKNLLSFLSSFTWIIWGSTWIVFYSFGKIQTKVGVKVSIMSTMASRMWQYLVVQLICFTKGRALLRVFRADTGTPQIQSHVTGLWWNPAQWVTGNHNRERPSWSRVSRVGIVTVPQGTRKAWVGWIFRTTEFLILPWERFQGTQGTCFALKKPPHSRGSGWKKGLFGDEFTSIFLC